MREVIEFGKILLEETAEKVEESFKIKDIEKAEKESRHHLMRFYDGYRFLTNLGYTDENHCIKLDEKLDKLSKEFYSKRWDPYAEKKKGRIKND